MATQIRAKLSAILPLIQTRLVTKTGLAAERIRIIARSAVKVPFLHGDSEILLRPLGFQVQQTHVQGMGRVSTLIRRRLEVILRTRVTLDAVGSDEVWLTESTNNLGHFVLEDSVVDALQIFWPEDTKHNVLTVEPMRLLGGQDPDKDDKSIDWGHSSLIFEVVHEAAVDQKEQ